MKTGLSVQVISTWRGPYPTLSWPSRPLWSSRQHRYSSNPHPSTHEPHRKLYFLEFITFILVLIKCVLVNFNSPITYTVHMYIYCTYVHTVSRNCNYYYIFSCLPLYSKSFELYYIWYYKVIDTVVTCKFRKIYKKRIATNMFSLYFMNVFELHTVPYIVKS